MSKILVLGAGKIGATAADMLAEAGDYTVTLADGDAKTLAARTPGNVRHRVVDVTNAAALKKATAKQDYVICALPFFLSVAVARAAKAAGAHYFDMTEDVATASAIRNLAKGAKTAFVCQSGLAPGFISIVANSLLQDFEELHDVRLRVGALPQYPDNSLKYNLTWSTDGLINEYCNGCDAIHEGRRRELMPLEGLERFSLDGIDYEAFSTSGGIGTLCDTLTGKARNVNYKTVRYPGHREMVSMLARDLKLCEHRDTFKALIEYGVPTTRQDVVLVFVTVTGKREGLLSQESYAKKIYGDAERGGRSAIQKTTAGAVCAMVDLHRAGKLPKQGFVRQEQLDFRDFIANRFGKVYA